MSNSDKTLDAGAGSRSKSCDDESKNISSFSWRKWILLPLLFAATILCGYFALPTTKSVAVSTPTKQITQKLITKNIEDIFCGERVLGKNPVFSEEDRKLFGAEPTRETHYEYFFALPKEDNSLTFVVLLRPRDWLEQNELVREFEEITETGEVETGIVVWLELPEMGAVGWAELLAINDDFEIKTGERNVVTGTFAHLANNIIDLKIEGQDSIGCTDNHPFWSVDRQEYIPAGKLQEGERVLLYSGETKRVEQKLPRPGPDIVYNIEVFGEHVYYVGDDGVLVHNTCKQIHHFATNKSKQFTPLLAVVVKKYKLDLNGEWNKALLPHQGRHANEYHKWVLAEMKEISKEAGRSKKKFLKLFQKNIIDKVKKNPDMLYRKGGEH